MSFIAMRNTFEIFIKKDVFGQITKESKILDRIFCKIFRSLAHQTDLFDS